MSEQISAKEAAELIGRSVSFIRMMKVSGALPFVQLGGRYTFNRRDVLNLFKKSEPHNNAQIELQ